MLKMPKETIELSTPVIKLRNLGPASAKQLARIGISSYADLKSRGAINCFVELTQLDNFQPSVNFLYALLGALEDQAWTLYKKQKGQLLLELEEVKELKEMFK